MVDITYEVSWLWHIGAAMAEKLHLVPRFFKVGGGESHVFHRAIAPMCWQHG